MTYKTANQYKFNLGQTVYLKTDPEQLERIITGIMLRPNIVSYGLTSTTDETWHYDFEMSNVKDFVKYTTG